MLEFDWPWIFALLPLPWLIRRFTRPVNSAQAALQVPFIDDFIESDQMDADHAVSLRTGLIIGTLIWLALLTAAASPRWVGEPIELPVKGRDIMLAVDLSGSMEKRDFTLRNNRVNRLMATKAVAGNFIRQRIGDRVGLILFGSRAYLQVPLTFDRQTVITLLDEAVTRIAGQETAIGDAIGLAVKRLRDRKGDRILILLSDGENTAGAIDPLKAADIAALDGLKIYTIGIGADGRNRGGNYFGMTRPGPRTGGIDERTLTQIAQKTGGRYFHAGNTQELEEIYGIIDRLEPVESDNRIYRPVKALFHWPLALSLILTLILMAIQSLARSHV